MTEAKSPREIAEELVRGFAERFTLYEDSVSAIESAILSYAADRERVIRDQVLEEAAGIADMCAETNLEAAGDSVLHDPVLSGEGFTPENVAKSESLITDGCIHSSMYHAATNIAAAIRLSSRPATEGKR